MKPTQQFYTPVIEPQLSAARAADDGLYVIFDNVENEHRFPWFWVRDHGIDAQNLDHNTLQRLTDTFSIPESIAAQSIELDKAKQLIHLRWNDKSQSTISAYMLASIIGNTPSRHHLAPEKPRFLWDKDNPLAEIPCLSYSEVMTKDQSLLAWLENIHVFGFSLLQDVPATEAATTELAKRVGQIQQTIFGGMWPLSSELEDHGDSAYTTSYLEPHTDSTYYHDAPGLQMFNCLQFDGKGGESIQVDGFAIAARIKREDPLAYQTLSEISVPGHYIEDGVHLRAERPTLRLNANGELQQVSFNNYDRAPFLLPDEELQRFHHAYALFHKHALDQQNWLKIPLTPGKTLIFDNWRNMHGRMGYVGKRVFYGCYHSRAEFESKLRVLQSENR